MTDESYSLLHHRPPTSDTDDSSLTGDRVLYETSHGRQQTTARNEVQATTAGPRHESKQLTERHIAIVAVAGMMGTGLFLTSGRSLVDAGPGGALLGYILVREPLYVFLYRQP